MRHRTVWPAIFSIMGASILCLFAGLDLFVILARPYYAPPTFNDLIMFLVFAVAALLQLVFSLTLLLDEAHRRLWGLLVLILSGVAGFVLIQVLISLLLSPLGPSPGLFILLSSIILGVTGRVWGLLWGSTSAKER